MLIIIGSKTSSTRKALWNFPFALPHGTEVLMRKIPWVTILASVVLGLVAGLIAHDYRTGIVLGTDNQHVSYSHKFSANGKFLASEATSTKEHDYRQELKLFDLETGQPVGQFPHANQAIWCCANDGSVLTAGVSFQFTKDSQGKDVSVYHYGCYRRDLGATKNTEICHWTMTDPPTMPPQHQFAFSRDGTILAHGRHENGKVWIECIDTKTGELKNTLPIDNASILIWLRELPRRNGFVAITHPAAKSGHDSTKSSLLMLDGQLMDIKARHEYENHLFEYWSFTGDGEHLYGSSSKSTAAVLIDLSRGSLSDLPSSTAEVMKQANKENNSIHSQLWPTEFGQSLLLTTTVVKTTTGTAWLPTSHLVDWTSNTCKLIEVTGSDDTLVSPSSWLPASQSIVLNRHTNHPPNPLVGWYHRLQRWMKWGNPPNGYQELAILDLVTMQKTTWIPISDSWTSIQTIPNPDGKKILIAMSNSNTGMRLELWDNPALPTLLPRGTYTGIAVMLLSFLLIRLLFSLRHRRLSQKPTQSVTMSSQSKLPGSGTV